MGNITGQFELYRVARGMKKGELCSASGVSMDKYRRFLATGDIAYSDLCELAKTLGMTILFIGVEGIVG